MSKEDLRKWAKEERKRYNTEELSKLLVQKLQETNEYKQAKNIMIFYPLEFELNMLFLLDDKEKKFYLPKIDGKNLLCCPYIQGEELCESCFKTKEPLTEPVEKDLIDLVIVPALAVDKDNYRLGYGGGFYDRFLTEIAASKIVCISKRFILDTIYPRVEDVPIDKIISA